MCSNNNYISTVNKTCVLNCTSLPLSYICICSWSKTRYHKYDKEFNSCGQTERESEDRVRMRVLLGVSSFSILMESWLFGSEPPLKLASLTCQVVEDTKLWLNCSQDGCFEDHKGLDRERERERKGSIKHLKYRMYSVATFLRKPTNLALIIQSNPGS